MIAKNTVTYLQIGKLLGHRTWPFVLRPFINASRNDQCVCVGVYTQLTGALLYNRTLTAALLLSNSDSS